MPNLSTGVKRRSRTGGSRTGGNRAGSKRTPKKDTSKKSKRKKQERILVMPKTAKLFSRKSRGRKIFASKANSGMSLTELQFLAKSRGIPFGGLTKTKLVRKINNYS